MNVAALVKPTELTSQVCTTSRCKAEKLALDHDATWCCTKEKTGRLEGTHISNNTESLVWVHLFLLMLCVNLRYGVKSRL